MIKTSVAKQIGETVKNTTQKVLQEDGVTHLAVIGETNIKPVSLSSVSDVRFPSHE